MYQLNAKRFAEKIYKLLKFDSFYFLILAEFLIYTTFWSTIAIRKNLALQTSVYDLGVFEQSLLLVLHGNLNYKLYFLGYSPFKFIIAPLELIPNLNVLLIFQTIFLALPIFPLYAISKKLKNGRIPSLLLSSGYLIFFSLSGINWFDVHDIAFFIFFFTMAYYFYINKKYLLAIIFFIISGSVRFPIMIYPLIFSVIIWLEILLNTIKHKKILDRKNLNFTIILTISSSVILIIQYFLDYILTHLGTSSVTSDLHIVSGISIFSSIDAKIVTLIVFIFPFFYLLTRKPKWLVMLIPFIIILFISNYSIYEFPTIAMYQYSSLIIPFLFLGAIDGLSTIKNDENLTEYKYTLKRKHKFFVAILKNKKLKDSFTIFVILLLLAMVFQPYGPLNSYSQDNYDLHSLSSINIQKFNALQQEVNLIPTNNPYVLFSNNMPEVLMHDPSISSVLTNYVFGFPYNLTYKLPNGTWTNRIDYVLADLNSSTISVRNHYPDNLSMYNVIHKLYLSGNYGILAEDCGFVLLKYNYSGPIKLYKPFNATFPASQLNISINSLKNNGIITGTNTTGQGIWFGPCNPNLVLSPGTYNITFHLLTTNNSKSNSILLWSRNYYAQKTFGEVTLNGSEFKETNILTNISMIITIHNFYNYVQFEGSKSYWNGSLSIYGITLKQISN